MEAACGPHQPLFTQVTSASDLSILPNIFSTDHINMHQTSQIVGNLKETFGNIHLKNNPIETRNQESAANLSTGSYDLESPIALNVNTTVYVKGKKCVLRMDPNTKQLVAYPIKSDGSMVTVKRKDTDDCVPQSELSEKNVNKSDSCIKKGGKESHALQGLLDLSDQELEGKRGQRKIKVSKTEEYEVDDVTHDSSQQQLLDTSQFQRETYLLNTSATGGLYAAGREMSSSLLKTIILTPVTPLQNEFQKLPSFPTTSIGRECTASAGSLPITVACNEPKNRNPEKIVRVDIIQTDPDNMDISVPNKEHKETANKYVNILLSNSDNDKVKGKKIADNLTSSKEPAKIGLRANQNELGNLRCVKCGYQAFYEHQYRTHVSSHADAFKCKCCSYVSFLEEDVIKHFKLLHPKCICSECNYMAEHKYLIKRHMQRHRLDAFTCEICKKKYKDQYILKMHLKMVHMPAEVLFQCEVCQKKFTRKAHLKRHMRIHDPEKPFKCPHCDYRGCERSDITKHELIHQDPKHCCEICGKNFRHVKNKELHLKRHRGQRDYKCGVCDFYGYTFTDIRKHIERKHADNPSIICHNCGTACRSEAHHKIHIKTCSEMLMVEPKMFFPSLANLNHLFDIDEPQKPAPAINDKLVQKVSVSESAALCQQLSIRENEANDLNESMDNALTDIISSHDVDQAPVSDMTSQDINHALSLL